MLAAIDGCPMPGRFPPLTPGSAPATSIVIRAFNEERWLPEVLEALAAQTYRDFEVVLVDSGSVDHTRSIAASYGARIVRLRSEDFTFGYALNIGIEASLGQYIAILSAHAIPTDSSWLESLLAPFSDHHTAMVFGGQRGHSISKFSEALDLERIFPQHPLIMDDDHVFVNNANSAIRRSLWNEHPFDEGLPGLEDAEWAKHWIPKGHLVRYQPSACIYHVHTESWPQVRHRFYREGVAGRWTAVRILRNIPGEILREGKWLGADILTALGRGQLSQHLTHILRYRYNKIRGTVEGILASRRITNPSKRAELLLDRRYAAVVVRGPHHAALEERSIPSLRPGEVLVRVAFEGVCATDLELAEGKLGYYRNGLGRYPIVPGHEFSGTVASLGKKVEGISEGDRVVVECIQGCGACGPCREGDGIRCAERGEVGVLRIDGGYAEYVVARARFVHRLPDAISLRSAALVEPLAVVLKGNRRLAQHLGEREKVRCAVIGGGPIGHLFAKVLTLQGRDVVLFEKDPSRGVHVNDICSVERALDGLERFDALIEATGRLDVLRAMLAGSRPGAASLLLGLPYGEAVFDFESLVAFDRVVIGSVGSSPRDFDDAIALLPRLDVGPLVASVYELHRFRDAWKAVQSRSVLKALIQVDPNAPE